MDKISTQYNNPPQQFEALIRHWLSLEPPFPATGLKPGWYSLAKAMEHPLVCHSEVTRKLDRKYINPPEEPNPYWGCEFLMYMYDVIGVISGH